jgi:hypothetical protein
MTPVCEKRIAGLFEEHTLNRIEAIVYSSNRPFAENKRQTLEVLTALKAKRPEASLLTLGGYINTKRRCSYYFTRSGNTAACALPENVAYFADHPEDEPYYREFMRLTDHFVDKIDLLCKNRVLETCATATPEGVPAFYDRHHLSLEFAQWAGRRYRERHPEIVDLLTGR